MTTRDLLAIYKESGSVTPAINSRVKATINLAECSFGFSAHNKPQLLVSTIGMLHALVHSVELVDDNTQVTEATVAGLLAAKQNYSQTDADGFSQAEAVVSGYFSLDENKKGRLTNARIEGIEQVNDFQIRTDQQKTIHVDRIRHREIPGNEGKGFSIELTGIDDETKLPMKLFVIADQDGQAFQDAIARTSEVGLLAVSGRMTVAGGKSGIVAAIAESNFDKKLVLQVEDAADRPAPELQSHPIDRRYTFEMVQNAANQPVMWIKGDGGIFMATGNRLTAELELAREAKPKAILMKSEMPQMQGHWRTRVVNGRAGSLFVVSDVHNPYRQATLHQGSVKQAEVSSTTKRPVVLER